MIFAVYWESTYLVKESMNFLNEASTLLKKKIGVRPVGIVDVRKKEAWLYSNADLLDLEDATKIRNLKIVGRL